MDRELADTIEQLYRAFRGYPLRPWTSPCTHCYTAEEERVVRRRPLRELEPDDLVEFACNALMTWGEVDDFRHFLPRLFEILAADRFNGWPDTETLVGALGRGDWLTWPPPEQEAVARFLMAWWRMTLSRPFSHRHPWRSAESVLSAIATSADDLDPYLELWASLPGDEPVLHLAWLLHGSDTALSSERRIANPWLHDRPVQEAQVVRWIYATAPAFEARIEALFHATDDERTLIVLDIAHTFASSAARPAR